MGQTWEGTAGGARAGQTSSTNISGPATKQRFLQLEVSPLLSLKIDYACLAQSKGHTSLCRDIEKVIFRASSLLSDSTLRAAKIGMSLASHEVLSQVTRQLIFNGGYSMGSC